MRTSVLISIVVGLHCAAIGALFFIQGCGTTPKQQIEPIQTMPPLKKPAELPEAMIKQEVFEPVKPAGPVVTEYIVKSGDYVGKIAKRFGVSGRELARLNQLDDPNKLRIGQKLIIPAGGKPVVSKDIDNPKYVKAAAPEAPVVKLSGNEYIVVAGDCLSKIAAKYGTTVRDLREANKLSGDRIIIGQRLVMPQAKAKGAALEEKTTESVGEVKDADVPGASLGVIEQSSVAAPAFDAAAAAGISAPSSGSVLYHVVQPVDDLDSIAKLYVVSADDIAELNHIPVDQPLEIGQSLRIP